MLFLLHKMMNQKQHEFKRAVFLQCKDILEQRIANSENAMKFAQESANSEEKSSAGDKYETSRAMGQLARDMNAKQLAEAKTELNGLLKLHIELLSDKIILGSMAETNNGIYFIAAGIGVIETKIKNRTKVIVLSAGAPLAKMMLGKKAGERFLFNGKNIEVINIY